MTEVKNLVQDSKVVDARAACVGKKSSPIQRIFLAGLQQAGEPRSQIKDSLSEVGRHEGMALGRGLVVLETVAIVAPLLGLLGTVWGMIDVFKAIETSGVGNAMALAGGIGTALYTTLAGLLVAIPVRVGHSIISSKVERLVLSMEEEALDLLDLLSKSNDATLPPAEEGSPEPATGPRAVS